MSLANLHKAVANVNDTRSAAEQLTLSLRDQDADDAASQVSVLAAALRDIERDLYSYMGEKPLGED